MVHITQRIKIAIKQNIEEKHQPKAMSFQKLYPVVAEKTKHIKRKNKDTGEMKDDEDIYYGYVGDDWQLHFVVSYNCYTVVDYETEEERVTLMKDEVDNFYRFLQKAGFKGSEK